ncbi:FxsA family protein [Herbivorax sp. ANBcel31]|uniref:FxsA family protein n=1 Tax=Herbivorax sp. ANBcel31 TaxID=3069754 RepID=UPI0027AE4852|nr:FxsA family protein [Herbivorax sp. ANBcel31]MDQ2084823.1 FxsA family protein [Herbivorax sp. ANBcel31]
MSKGRNLLTKLILLFTVIPVLELYVLIKITSMTSILSTIGIIVFSGIIGAYLAKSEGRIVIRRIKLDINSGRLPGDELINGLCVLIGGALLLTPGVITDILGFSLIIPGTRGLYRKIIKTKLYNLIQAGDVKVRYKYYD